MDGWRRSLQKEVTAKFAKSKLELLIFFRSYWCRLGIGLKLTCHWLNYKTIFCTTVCLRNHSRKGYTWSHYLFHKKIVYHWCWFWYLLLTSCATVGQKILSFFWDVQTAKGKVASNLQQAASFLDQQVEKTQRHSGNVGWSTSKIHQLTVPLSRVGKINVPYINKHHEKLLDDWIAVTIIKWRFLETKKEDVGCYK